MKRLLAAIAAVPVVLLAAVIPAAAAKPTPVAPHITYVVGQWTSPGHTTFALTARAAGVTSTYGVQFHVVAYAADGTEVAEDAGNVPMRSGAGTGQRSSAPFAVSMPTADQVDVSVTLYQQKGRGSVTIETVTGNGSVGTLDAWDAWVEFYQFPTS